MASPLVFSSGAKPLNVAVVGAGAFGRHHVRIYSELAKTGAVCLAAIVDQPENAAARALAQEHGAAFFPDVQALVDASGPRRLAVDAASVCVPTVHHAQAAGALLKAGMSVLVEKPISPTLQEADRLLQLATENKRILQVGHLERFNPAVTAVLPHLTRPMFFECHRLSIFSPRSLDVDVVLDLMIHDLDIVLRMVKSPVLEIRAVGLPVLTNHADIANVRLEFESGCVANFTASRVSTERVRKLRLFQPQQYISIDYARQEAFRIEVPATAAAQIAANPGQEVALDGLDFHKFPVQAGEPLRLEIEAFLHAVRTGEPSPVPAHESRDALALALAVIATMEGHGKRAGLYWPGKA